MKVLHFLPLFSNIVKAVLVFPYWLKELTHCSTWPSENAPYIYEKHHFHKRIPDHPIRKPGECTFDNESSVCSFDCHNCVGTTDITSCDPISQTFDDGPSYATPKLLNYLKKTKTKTTFFLIGMNVVEMPSVVRREHKDGHLLAVHTWSHKFLPELSNEEVFAELQWCIWAINITSGVVPRYFRPPYGAVDNRIREIASQLGLITVLWDRDTRDWELHEGSKSDKEIIQEVSLWTKSNEKPKKWYEGTNAKAKGLILEHDLHHTNVLLATKIHKVLKHNQKTVAQCAKSYNYQKGNKGFTKFFK